MIPNHTFSVDTTCMGLARILTFFTDACKVCRTFIVRRAFRSWSWNLRIEFVQHAKYKKLQNLQYIVCVYPIGFWVFLYEIRICCYKLNKMHMHRHNINHLIRIYIIEIDWIISNHKLGSCNIMHLKYIISSCHQRIATEYHLWMKSMNLTIMILKKRTKIGCLSCI